MKITKQQLKQIIKEEMGTITESPSAYNVGDTLEIFVGPGNYDYPIISNITQEPAEAGRYSSRDEGAITLHVTVAKIEQ